MLQINSLGFIAWQLWIYTLPTFLDLPGSD